MQKRTIGPSICSGLIICFAIAPTYPFCWAFILVSLLVGQPFVWFKCYASLLINALLHMFLF
jgi:hypothetical protein